MNETMSKNYFLLTKKQQQNNLAWSIHCKRKTQQ